VRQHTQVRVCEGEHEHVARTRPTNMMPYPRVGAHLLHEPASTLKNIFLDDQIEEGDDGLVV
jgi:hypothetical protein